MANKASLYDKVLLAINPAAGLERLRAKQAASIMLRHYEAASTGRRTQGWNRVSGDANSMNQANKQLRDVARDLERNNPWVVKGLNTITGNVVGWGITPKPTDVGARAGKAFAKAWKKWAETTQCDFDNQLTFYAMQRKVLRSVVRDGEVLVRRHFRQPADGLAIPLKLQMLEADHLDTEKNQGQPAGGGNFIIQGVEYNGKGERVAYWIHPTHPGNVLPTFSSRLNSVRISADEILHIYRGERVGQARGVTWFAPVILRLKDFDEYEDATLLRQKIAACFVGFITNMEGTGTAVVGAPPGGTPAPTDGLEEMQPGFMKTLAPGQSVEFGESPSVSEFDPYSKSVQRGIAAGIGITYEQFTGDYSNVNYSSARMARLEFQNNVEEWQYHLLIPMFCAPAFEWAALAAMLGGVVGEKPGSEWMPPPMKMLEPDKEVMAVVRQVRAGLKTLQQALRELGLDPDTHIEEFKEMLNKLDENGIILDIDPRKTTQAGNKYDPTPKQPAGGAKQPAS